jgi:hypothetical protein
MNSDWSTHLLVLLPRQDDVVLRTVVGNESLLDVLDICLVVKDGGELDEAAPDGAREPPVVGLWEHANLSFGDLGPVVLVAGHQALSIRRRGTLDRGTVGRVELEGARARCKRKEHSSGSRIELHGRRKEVRVERKERQRRTAQEKSVELP